MSRDFTLKEKILLGVLVLILLGLVYYRFVDTQVRTSIENSEVEAAEYQTELDGVQREVMRLQGIKNNMDALEAEDNLSWMPSYNNSQDEVAFLNLILADTLQYSISFADVTRSGDQIRRSFTLQYRTENYKQAQDIMARLLKGKNRCLIGDVKCTIDTERGTVTMNQAATFYETMVGGTPDNALPADSAAANS